MMRTRLHVLFFASLMFGNSVLGQTSYQNPIIRGMNPDPSICRVGDDYYMVTSTFEYFPGLPIYQSKDLVNWKLIGHVLTRPAQLPLLGAEASVGGLYAPTIRYHDGTFYVVCTNYGGKGSQGSFYVTARNITGPWSEPHWVGSWACDPSLLFANDSVYYTFPGDNGHFYQAALNLGTGKFDKSPRKLAKGQGGSSPEGPHLYKISEFYYLMSAEGGTGFQHREVIQRSKSPWGPFEPCPSNPIVTNMNTPKHPFQAIGHADIVETPDGWWLVCLGVRAIDGEYHHLGRETFLAPVKWASDGWPHVGLQGTMKDEYGAPKLPQHPWPKEPARDDFDSTGLRLAWNFVRNPNEGDWSLAEKPGSLRLKGSAINFTGKDCPAYICRRQTEFNMAISSRMSFSPTTSNEEAGLVARGDDKNHYDLLVTLLGGKRVVMCRKVMQNKIASVSYKDITDGDVILRITATAKQYKFWVQETGKMPVALDSATTYDLSTEKIGGFTGVYMGMYASGNGATCANPADFDWFDFEENPAHPFAWMTGTTDTQNGMTNAKMLGASSSRFDNASVNWSKVDGASGYVVERSNDRERFDSVMFTTQTSFTDTSVQGNILYSYRVLAVNDKGRSLPSVSISVNTLPKPGPFHGKPAQIPGKIEAEDYDNGKSNEAFYDNDQGNNGGQYRSDNVDIEMCWDEGKGYQIANINANEWLAYTVDINEPMVDIELRVASEYGGGIMIEHDDNTIVDTPVKTTGGWSSWKTVTIPNVKMNPGKNKTIHVMFTNPGFNLNWINFKINK